MSQSTSRTLFKALMRQAAVFQKELQIRLPVGQSGWHGRSIAFFDRLEDYDRRILGRILPEALAGLTSATVSRQELCSHIKAKFREPVSEGDEDNNLKHRHDLAFDALRELAQQDRMAACSSTTTTRGIQIDITSNFIGAAALPPGADTDDEHYLFTYRCTISNVGDERVMLRGRHWIIKNAHGAIHAEVPRGSPGVVGFTPDLQPGAVFQYHSSTTLNTAHGTMQGSFQMVPLNAQERPGPGFDAIIRPFDLISED